MKKIILFIFGAIIPISIFLSSCSTKFIPAVPTPYQTPAGAIHTPTAISTTVVMLTATATRTFTAILTPTLTGTYSAGSVWVQSAPAAAFSARTQFAAMVFNNKMWVVSGANATGCFKDSWSSTDGITWTPVSTNTAFSGRYGHTGTVFTNQASGPAAGTEKMWIIGGYNGSYLQDVWCSSDGNIWTNATLTAGFGNRAEHSTVVHNGKMWVIAGGLTGDARQNDVYSSPDGVTWSQVTSNAGFTKRKQHSSVEFNNYMWVIGGISNTGNFLNDVWYSSDGVTWTCATANAAFTPRSGHTSFIYDNKMWVVGGYISATGKMNDCWYSSDGVTWTKAQVTTPFSARVFHSSVVYDNKMWVIAGINTAYLNSVWWSQ